MYTDIIFNFIIKMHVTTIYSDKSYVTTLVYKHTQITIGRSSDVFGVRHNIGGNAHSNWKGMPFGGFKDQMALMGVQRSIFGWAFVSSNCEDSAATNSLMQRIKSHNEID